MNPGGMGERERHTFGVSTCELPPRMQASVHTCCLGLSPLSLHPPCCWPPMGTQARADLEAQNREAELAGMRQELEAADAKLAAAVLQAEAALNAAWQEELERAKVCCACRAGAVFEWTRSA